VRKTVIALTLGALAGATGLLLLFAHHDSSSKDLFAQAPQGPYRGSEPPGTNLLPTFSLPRYDGSGTVRSRQLRGRVVLTTFVDSACHDSCPIIVGILGHALHKLSGRERSRVTALAFSVHPGVDTKAHVHRFLADRGALGELDYLVAPARQMKPVWKSFHVLPATETGNDNVHSADVRVFDKNGVWVSTLNVGADLSVPNLLHDIRTALEAKPRPRS
jgi:cytochrome oxidase Cu insertion factor (SCO1/SenC/PrrC family)